MASNLSSQSYRRRHIPLLPRPKLSHLLNSRRRPILRCRHRPERLQHQHIRTRPIRQRPSLHRPIPILQPHRPTMLSPHRIHTSIHNRAQQPKPERRSESHKRPHRILLPIPSHILQRRKPRRLRTTCLAKLHRCRYAKYRSATQPMADRSLGLVQHLSSDAAETGRRLRHRPFLHPSRHNTHPTIHDRRAANVRAAENPQSKQQHNVIFRSGRRDNSDYWRVAHCHWRSDRYRCRIRAEEMALVRI